jgi:hypothetical protein
MCQWHVREACGVLGARIRHRQHGRTRVSFTVKWRVVSYHQDSHLFSHTLFAFTIRYIDGDARLTVRMRAPRACSSLPRDGARPGTRAECLGWLMNSFGRTPKKPYRTWVVKGVRYSIHLVFARRVCHHARIPRVRPTVRPMCLKNYFASS